jgi:Rps23 Pro-64 3,4-dihydroxylase Tpa1-like proline 4-hydroxylase
MQIEDYIKVYENAIPITCVSSLIKWINEKKPDFQDATVGNGVVDKDIREVQTTSLMNWNNYSLTKVHWCNLLTTSFIESALRYRGEVSPDVSIQQVLDIDLLKYEKGAKYKVHCDHYSQNPRTLSFILLLNNNYKGGLLNFYNQNGDIIKTINPAPAKLVVWPSNFLFPHSVSEVTEGVRYSIVSWAL